MRNIQVLAHTSTQLENAGAAVVAYDINDELSRVFLATEAGDVHAFDTSKVDSAGNALCTCSLPLPPGLDGGPQRVLCIAHSIDLSGLVVATAAGDLFFLHLDHEHLEPIGAFDSAVLALAWSPDGELLAILTAAGRLLLMTQDWNVEAEVAVASETSRNGAGTEGANGWELNGAAGASVSWRGDSACLVTVTQAVDEPAAVLRIWSKSGCTLEAVGDVAATECVGLTPVAAYQPNGRHAYAAVCKGARSAVSLFERNGLGHGQFDVPANAEEKIFDLKWSIDSELLGVVLGPRDGSPGRWRVQLWLRSNWHWYLKLERCWECTARLFARWSESAPAVLHTVTADGAHDRVQLAYGPNVSSFGTAIVIDGHQVALTPLRHGLVPPPCAAARVAFGGAVVAAGLGAWTGCEVVAAVTSTGRLEFAASVEEDLWEETAAEASERNGTAATEEEAACQVQEHVPPLQAAAIDLQPDALPHGLAVRHIAWLSRCELMLVGLAPTGTVSRDVLLYLELQWPEDAPDGDTPIATPSVAAVHTLDCPSTSQIAAIASCPELDTMLLHSADGGVYCVTSSWPDAPGMQVLFMLPECCRTLACVPDTNGALRSFALGPSGRLYAGERVIAMEATSMTLRRSGPGGPALLHTTRGNTLMVSLLDALDESPAVVGASRNGASDPPPKAGLGDGKRDNVYKDMHRAMRPRAEQLESGRQPGCRAVEQGAVLVACPPGGTCTVLQMPRGNLEGVHVRLLSLLSVAEALDEARYGDAFSEAWLRRVDLNFVVDWRWPRFLDAAERFVQQIDDPEDVCALLLSLNAADCTAPGALYAFATELQGNLSTQQTQEERAEEEEQQAVINGLRGQASSSASAGKGADKVNSVCSAVREACQARGGAFLRCVIMSYIRSEPRNLEEAVQVLHSVKQAELEREDSEGAESSELVNFLLVHVDAEEAYRAALAHYQLQTAYMIIAASQRDPAEYLLQLQEFHAVHDDHLRRFNIDAFLGRHLRALQHIVAAGEKHVDRAIDHARRHNLLRELLTMLEGERKLRDRVMRVYAEGLESDGKLPDAAVAFLACRCEVEAARCYEAAGEWEMTLSLTQRSGAAPAAVRRVAASCIERLLMMGRTFDAGTVAASYLNDASAALQHFSDGGHWRAALGVVYQARNPELLQTSFAPALARAAEASLKDLVADTGRIEKYSERLRLLRDKRAAMAAAIGEQEEVDELADGFSDVVSLASNMSAYTDRSTRAGSTLTSGSSASTLGGRRANKKKKGRGKIRQGTPEEEQKLCTLLSELAPSPALCTQVSQMVEALVFLGHEQDATKIQTALDKYCKGFLEAADDVLANPSPPANPSALARTAAERTAADIRHKVYDLRHTTWKWDLLRPPASSAST